MLKRIGQVAGITAAGLVLTALPALAADQDGATDNAKAVHGGDDNAQHGGTDGHLPPVTDDMTVISQLGLRNVEPGGIADVAVYGDYAYVAAWGSDTCKANGVHVVDLSDVQNPVEVAFVPSKEGSYPGEGMQVTSISTAAFTGDVLVTNNEICKDKAGFGGINIYDVTNPARPTPLAVGFGDYTDAGKRKKTANETHSVFAWDAGDRAYAAMIDNEELADIDIVDITNPKKPVLVTEYDLAELFPQILQPDAGLDEVFAHDVVVRQVDGRFVMYAAYWDAGYVALDVTDPLAPEYLADSDFDNPDPESGVAPEGNAHYADVLGNGLVIGADEDFAPYALDATNLDDDTPIDASQGSGTTPLDPGTTLTGESVFVGRACPGDAAVPPGDGTQIAVVERGACDFTVKVAAIEAAGGYVAILVFNREGADACNATLGMTVEGGLPTFGVAPREQGFAVFNVEDQYDDTACRAGDGTQLAPIQAGAVGDELTFSSSFDGWGYVRLLNGDLQELDTYAIPEAFDPDLASGSGDLSVHEVAPSQTNPNLAYLAYYSGGVRVIDTSTGSIEEVGAFIAEDGSNIWGVETLVQDGVEYVVVSDRDYGLYILRYTPTT